MTVQIFIKTFRGDTLPIDIEEKATGAELKKAAEAAIIKKYNYKNSPTLPIYFNSIRYFISGKDILDDSSLDDYDISQNATIHQKSELTSSNPHGYALVLLSYEKSLDKMEQQQEDINTEKLLEISQYIKRNKKLFGEKNQVLLSTFTPSFELLEKRLKALLPSQDEENLEAFATDLTPESKIQESEAKHILHLEEIDLRCPITQGPPEHPIIASDGHIYDKANLEAWREQDKTSPITKMQLKKTLIPFKLLEKILTAGNPFQLKETDLICPLTKRFMREPVLASDGILYDRKPIEKAARPRTPLLFEPLCIKDWRGRLLKQNPKLEKRISEEDAREIEFKMESDIPDHLSQLEDDEPIVEDNEARNADVSGSDIRRYMAHLLFSTQLIDATFDFIPREEVMPFPMSQQHLIDLSISLISLTTYLSILQIHEARRLESLSLVQQNYELARQSYEEEKKHTYSPFRSVVDEIDEGPHFPPVSLHPPQHENSSEDESNESLEDNFFEESDETPVYRPPNYPPLPSNHRSDIVLSGSQVMPSIIRTSQPPDENLALSLKLEAYYGSPPQVIRVIEGEREEKAFAVTFNMENAGFKLKQYERHAVNNFVHFKKTTTSLARIDIENATTHSTLLTKLKNYLHQLDGSDDSGVTAFFRARTLGNASPKKIRIQTLRDILMKDLPANFDRINPTRQEHYAIINRNIVQFQKAMNDNDNVLLGSPREPIALNYTKQAVSYVSCGLYQPAPPKGQELIQDINRLVKTTMRI